MLEELVAYERKADELHRDVCGPLLLPYVKPCAALHDYAREHGFDASCRTKAKELRLQLRYFRDNLEGVGPHYVTAPSAEREEYFYTKKVVEECLDNINKTEWRYSSMPRRVFNVIRDVALNPMGGGLLTTAGTAMTYNLIGWSDHVQVGAIASTISSFAIGYLFSMRFFDTPRASALGATIAGTVGSVGGAVAGYTAHDAKLTFGIFDPGSLESALASGFLLGPVVTIAGIKFLTEVVMGSDSSSK